MTSHLMKGALQWNIQLSFPFSTSPSPCFCSKLTLHANSKANGRLSLQQADFKSWHSDKNSEGCHQMSGIMSHREMELHKPHFPQQDCASKCRDHFMGCWNYFIFPITFLEQKREAQKLSSYSFQDWAELENLRAKVLCFQLWLYQWSVWKRKTSYVVNKEDPSRAKSYCNICVYLLAVLELFSWGTPGRKFWKQGNILILTSMCCICIYANR